LRIPLDLSTVKIEIALGVFTLVNNKNDQSRSNYHHGDLRQTLLLSATKMIEENGIDSLSLRKLASEVGVSRTAPYHHFKDKNQLLCAIAEEGYKKHLQRATDLFDDKTLSMDKKFSLFVHNYVKLAYQNPELYELMFGHAIWKTQKSTQELRNAAYPCFHHQVEMTKQWQQVGLLKADENTLRLAQVIWGTLHGITKLLIDGIYTDPSNIEKMCECAIDLFTQNDFVNKQKQL